MKRREMILKTAGMIGGICYCSSSVADDPEKSGCCYTPLIEPESIVYLESSVIIDLEKAVTISEPGFAAYLVNQEMNIQMIVFQTRDKKFHALSRFCTHAGQVVSYIRERGLVQCNNFNHSIFEVSGKVFKGPADAPLTAYESCVDENRLIITLS